MTMSNILLKDHEIELPQFKEGEKKNAGSLSLDVTVVPADMTYPTDLKLLTQVRKKTESIIDICHEQSGQKNKPKTGHRVARKEYLEYAKAKRLISNKRWTANRIQLQYIRKNIQSIETRAFMPLVKPTGLNLNFARQSMINNTPCGKQRTIDMITELSVDPKHVRCIVCGKAGSSYEFGP